MMRAPMAPLLLCLIGSDDERFVAPNSAGEPNHVGTPLTVSTLTVPAYHSYVLGMAGFTVGRGCADVHAAGAGHVEEDELRVEADLGRRGRPGSR